MTHKIFYKTSLLFILLFIVSGELRTVLAQEADGMNLSYYSYYEKSDAYRSDNMPMLSFDSPETQFEQLPLNTWVGMEKKNSYPGFRSLFQKFTIDGSWMPSGGDGGMGMTRFGINTSMMLPGPTLLSNRKSFFSISPKFEYTGIDWDRDTVFPSSLYSAGASITWMQPINERWTGMITASPQWSSDGKESRYSVNCPTIFGLTWTPNSRWKVMMGAAYLGRGDIPFIPFGGVTWTPNEDWRVELMAPQARILRRLTAYSNDDKQHWIFGAVGFGGGSWAIRSVDDRADLAEYREFSALFGYEFIRKNTNLKIEAGYVFGREMKFDKNTQAKYKPDDAFVLRMQYSF